jgi:hypothetical protein
MVPPTGGGLSVCGSTGNELRLTLSKLNLQNRTMLRPRWPPTVMLKSQTFIAENP